MAEKSGSKGEANGSTHPGRQKLTTTLDGKQYELIEEPFTVVKQDWAEFRLESGQVLRLMIVPQKMYRVVDENGEQVRSNGDPVIQFKHQLVSAASDPK